MTWLILAGGYVVVLAVILCCARNAKRAGERFDRVMADHLDTEDAP